MSGLLSISLTGLNAAQAGLTTTSHNISNASVDGYNRQEIVQSTATPLFTGVGFFGQGTEVSTVKRVYSQFLSAQVLAADTSRASFNTYYNEISQIDNMLADSSTGLSSSLESFFAGVQQVAADASNVSARQSMLSASESLVTRFHTMEAQIQGIRDGVETQIGQAVSDINDLSSQIATLNQQIVNAQVAGPDVPANDLLDQRDALVAQLNQQIKVTTTTNSDSTINVFVGTGQPLVVGNSAFTLSTVASASDSSRSEIGIELANGNVVTIPEDLLSGGSLGGLLSFRSGALDEAENSLGRIAVSLVTTFNAQHQLGQDLDGELGGNYFTPLTSTVQNLPNLTTGTDSTASITGSISNVAGLTTDDYVLSYDGTNYTLARTSDSSVVYNGSSLPTGVDGLSFTGTMATGDRVLVQPTKYAARNISMAINDTRLIAAASPVVSSAASTNTGSGAISQPSVVSLTGIQASAAAHLSSNVTLTFDSANNQFTVTGATPATIAYNPSSNAVGSTVTLTDPNLSFTISGRPSNGDVFTISTNTNGGKDNRNANALYALQSTKSLLGGTSTLGTAYSQMVSEVGTKTSSAKANTEAQQALLDQATTAQQSLSGVNMDEEAANLLRYQQAYQASARCISVAQTLFDDIISIMR